MSIERRFDISLIAGMALREKQIQQNYRPIIGVHKWFARRQDTERKRPGTCTSRASALDRAGPAGRGRCESPSCGHSNAYPGTAGHPLAHRLFADAVAVKLWI